MLSLTCSIIITILVVRKKRGSHVHNIDINDETYEDSGPIASVPKQSKAMLKPVPLSSNIGYSKKMATYNKGEEQAHVDYEYMHVN